MFRKVKKSELCGRLCAVAATERLERMEILSDQNTGSVKTMSCFPGLCSNQ